jgi:hypothetical protein
VSIAAIRTALGNALSGMSPALATEWPNIVYVPVVGTPYQTFNVMFATPDDNEIGAGATRFVEQGYLAIGLRYPAGSGPDAADARAQLIRNTFTRGATFVSGGVTVMITHVPRILPGRNDEDRYVVPVQIPFQAQV